MKRQIRQNVFETNSSSSHTVTVSKPKDNLGWKLEDYSGQKLTYGSNTYFDPAELQGKICSTSGTKFSLLFSIINEFIDNLGVPEKICEKMKGDDIKLANLPVYTWVQEFLKEKYNIDLVYGFWEDDQEFGQCYLDCDTSVVLWEIYKFAMGIDDGYTYNSYPRFYTEEKFIEVLKDEASFKEFMYKVLSNPDVVLVDEYEEL